MRPQLMPRADRAREAVQAADPIVLRSNADVLRERMRLVIGGGSGPRNDTLRAQLVYLAARAMLTLEAYDREQSRG